VAKDGSVATALLVAGIALSLLIIGFESRTLVRHIVQVIPAAVALVLILRRHAWGIPAALAIFGFWLVLVVRIWLFLIGIPIGIHGRFTAIEILLTLIIGALCVWGLMSSCSQARGKWSARIAGFVVFLSLQQSALWLSLRPFLAHR
jgi:hypothetical protein